MYKININAAFYENNLKINKQPNRIRYSLTQHQKQFIEMNLPPGYRLNLVGQMDEKRNRTPKRAEAEFETQFYKKQPRRQVLASDKKNDKKQERKPKQKQHGSNKEEVLVKVQSFQEDVKLVSSKKQVIESKKAGKIQNQIQALKSLQMIDEVKNFELKLKSQQLKLETAKNQQLQVQKNKQVAKSYSNQQICKQDEKILEKNPQEQIAKIKSDQANQGVFESKSHELNSFDHKQFCLRFIGKIKAHKSSWPFRQPVDPVTQGVPNYLQVIHEPMDLKTIEKKINTGKYEHIAQFHGDINKIFLNSYKFNPKQTNYYALTMELESYYHELLKQIKTNPNALENDRPTKNIRAKTQNSQQDFADQPINKKSKLDQVPKPIENPAVSHNQSAVVEAKQKTAETLLKQTKVGPKLKQKKIQIDRKELLKRVHKLSSKGLERILLTTFGELEDEKTTFNLDFEKLPEQSILKIDTIVKAELERFSQPKNGLAGLQKRMLLF